MKAELNWKALRAAAVPWLVLLGIAAFMATVIFTPTRIFLQVMPWLGGGAALFCLCDLSRHLYQESLRKQQREAELAAREQNSAKEPR